MQDGLYIRVKQAIAWLKRNQGILQKDIADRMGMAEASFTRALARIKEKNDEDFVISFHSAVSDFISLDYLLHGVGSLVTEDETVTNQQLPDMSSVFNSALAAKDEAITALKARIVDLQQTIADKVEIIKSRDARIADLERQLAAVRMSDMDNYPFSIGAAEGEIQPNI